MFLDCSYAQSCWQQVEVAVRVNNVKKGAVSFTDWLFKIIKRVSD